MRDSRKLLGLRVVAMNTRGGQGNAALQPTTLVRFMLLGASAAQNMRAVTIRTPVPWIPARVTAPSSIEWEIPRGQPLPEPSNTDTLPHGPDGTRKICHCSTPVDGASSSLRLLGRTVRPASLRFLRLPFLAWLRGIVPQVELRWPVVFALSCIIALPPVARDAVAQTPRVRSALARLAAYAQDTGLHRPNTKYEFGSVPTSAHIPLGDIERGMLFLRSALELGGRENLDAAQAAFDEAIYRAPADWPWPWYGLALADLALERGGYTVKPSMHQPAGVYYRDAAIHALGKALEADSTFAPAAKLLAERLTSTSDPAVSGEVVRAIRRSVASGGAGPQPWLVFARMQRSMEHPDSALDAFRHYLAAGGDSAVAYIEEARSLLASGDSAAAAPMYLLGAAHVGTSDGKAEYRRDLAWIASPLELATYDSLSDDSLGGWIRAFWSKRGAEDLREPGERLTEHVRRWVYVHDNFMAPQLSTRVAKALRTPLATRGDLPPSMAASMGDASVPTPGLQGVAPLSAAELFQQSYLNVATGSADFLDDRALIYMRHGEPSTIVQTPGRPHEHSPLTWAYATTQGQLVFHFACDLFCLLQRFPVKLDGLIAIDAEYETLAGQLRVGHPSPGVMHRVLSDIDRDLRVGLTTDGFPPHFKHQIEPEAQFFAVGAPGQVLVVFALPGEKLEHVALPDGGAGYPVVLRVIATNAAGQIVRLDTTRRFRADQPLGKGQYLFGLEQLTLTPGTWDVRLLVTEPELDAGGAIGRIGVTIPPDTKLALSDLVLGREGSGLAWQSPAGTVPLNPLDAFPPKGSAELYYELHGATPDSTYQTDIEVKGVYGDAKGTVHLTFKEKAHDALVRARRSIGLSKLEEGQYQVTVTVTEQGTGKTAVQSRYLNVRE